MSGTPVVAIIGRPNVGKSALFNRIVGGHTAIVSEEAGTTRDRHFGRAEWNGRSFWLVDTGGLPENTREAIDGEIRKQVLEAIAEADLLAFVVDAQLGVPRARISTSSTDSAPASRSPYQRPMARDQVICWMR
jgi:GTPase